MANSADPDQLASEEANWLGSALFANPDQLLLQKPTDLDLHLLQRQNMSGFSRTSVNLQGKHTIWNILNIFGIQIDKDKFYPMGMPNAIF